LKQLQNIGVYFTTAIGELKANKVRTSLSLLGITIGIFCIIAVFSIVDSLKANIKDSLSSLGNDVLYINKFAWMPEKGDKEYAWWRYKSRPQSKYHELRTIKANVPSVAYAALIYTSNQTLKYGNNSVENVRVTAVTQDFNKVQNFDIQYGRYFSPKDMSGLTSGLILGHNIAKQLCGTYNCIGYTVQLYGTSFKVIGVLKQQGKDASGFDYNNLSLVSYLQINALKGIEHSLSDFEDNTLMVRPRNNVSFTEMCFEVKGVLRALRKVKPGEPDNFSFNYLSMIQNQVEKIFKSVNAAGFFIGIFSLLVGAFGIANIMFVSVKERTSQIGLKKALGAPSSTILLEFLAEAITLCLIGGLLGIIVVYLLAALATHVAHFPITLSFNNFMIGIVISSLVGLISGYIPARRASRLNPVEAIRS
jgi:putative ABC transport system permease protein